MPKNIENAVRYNLYYIFKEDKEQNQLQKRKALVLWENIIKALNKKN